MRVARGGGGGGFFVVQPFPWDHEQSCCHHELSHGLMVKSKKPFPPAPREGLMVMLNMDQAMMESLITKLYVQWFFVRR